jgi:hypothetical protein
MDTCSSSGSTRSRASFALRINWFWLALLKEDRPSSK